MPSFKTLSPIIYKYVHKSWENVYGRLRTSFIVQPIAFLWWGLSLKCYSKLSGFILFTSTFPVALFKIIRLWCGLLKTYLLSYYGLAVMQSKEKSSKGGGPNLSEPIGALCSNTGIFILCQALDEYELSLWSKVLNTFQSSLQHELKWAHINLLV